MQIEWQIRKLGELCILFDDGDWIESKDQSDDGIRLIQTGNVGVGQFKDRAEKARYISEDTFLRLKCTEIVEGDCLVSRLPDPVGRACIIPNVGEKMITAVDCTIIRFKRDKINAHYFNYYAQSHSYLSSVESLITGATRQRISRSNLGQVSIPVPPLREQQRIVAMLDKAFAGIAAATENAKKNLQNARELFESHLQSIFTTQGNGWVEKKLGDLVVVQSGSGFPTKHQGKVTGGIPFYKVSDMNLPGNERQMLHENNSVTEEVRKELRASIFPKGSVIFPKVGGAIATNKKRLVINNCCVDNNVMGVIPRGTQIISGFLYYFFLGHNLSDFANKAHLPSITKTTVENWPLRVPSSPSEQHRIVIQLDTLATETRRLEAIYQQKVDYLAALKQSILQKAFAGELHMDRLAA